MNSIYTIKYGNKTVGFTHKQRPYVIGFENPRLCAKVKLGLAPQPIISIVRGSEDEDLARKAFVMDTRATLFISRFQGSSADPMNDGGYHTHTGAYKDFVLYPFSKQIGVIIPSRLVEENEYEFMLECTVIEPVEGLHIEYFQAPVNA
jgi:hypothetical protein